MSSVFDFNNIMNFSISSIMYFYGSLQKKNINYLYLTLDLTQNCLIIFIGFSFFSCSVIN